MNHETDIVPDNLKKVPKPTRAIDAHRAIRELERWLFNGMNEDSIPRPDQHGTSDTYERLPTVPSMPANWQERGEHLMTIVYRQEHDENGKIINTDISYLDPEGEQIYLKSE